MSEEPEAEPRTVQELERERQIMIVAGALKPMYQHPGWTHLQALQASLADEIAHTAMRTSDMTLDYWRGRYDGLRGLLAKVDEIMTVSAEIDARHAEELASEKLKETILDRKRRATRQESVEDGLVGE